MSFCPQCGTEHTKGVKKVLFGKYKGWCLQCAGNHAYEAHYKKHPEKRPAGDTMTPTQGLIAILAHQKPAEVMEVA